MRPSSPYRAPRHRTDRSVHVLSPGWSVPVPNSERPVRVVSVVGSGTFEVTWTFDSQIFEVWDTIAQLEVSADGVNFLAPLYTDNTDPFQFVATYAAPIPAGSAFRVFSQFDTMTFLYDKLLALPQYGAVMHTGVVASPAPSQPGDAAVLIATAATPQRKSRRRRTRKSKRHPNHGTRRAA